LEVKITEDRAAGGTEGEHTADGGDDTRPPEGAGAARSFACVAASWRSAVSCASRARRTARLDFDDAAEHIVRELDAADIETFLDAEKAAGDESVERGGRRAGGGKEFLRALKGDVFAVTGIGEQLVLDEVAHRGRWSASVRS